MRVEERSRKALDARLAAFPPADRSARPPRGWVRAVRDALGMTSAQLAGRLGVGQPSVVRLEQSEAAGTISLRTLRRAAEALDCTLVYALVPNSTLTQTVTERARVVAAQRLAEVEHTMLLEAQDLDRTARPERLEELARDLVDDRTLWR